MLTEKRITISLTDEQYKFIEEVAKERFEGRFSQALRYLVEKAIKAKFKVK